MKDLDKYIEALEDIKTSDIWDEIGDKALDMAIEELKKKSKKEGKK